MYGRPAIHSAAETTEPVGCEGFCRNVVLKRKQRGVKRLVLVYYRMPGFTIGKRNCTVRVLSSYRIEQIGVII